MVPVGLFVEDLVDGGSGGGFVDHGLACGEGGDQGRPQLVISVGLPLGCEVAVAVIMWGWRSIRWRGRRSRMSCWRRWWPVLE